MAVLTGVSSVGKDVSNLAETHCARVGGIPRASHPLRGWGDEGRSHIDGAFEMYIYILHKKYTKLNEIRNVRIEANRIRQNIYY